LPIRRRLLEIESAMSATNASFAIAPALQSRREELANTLTHLLALTLSIIGLPTLLHAAPPGIATIGSAIFGGSLILLYAASTAYHGVAPGRLKMMLRRADHMSIYVLIAGTYTLVALTLLDGWWVPVLLGLEWFIAIVGILFKGIYGPRWERLSTGLYLLMGWMGAFFVLPILEQLPTGALGLLMLGGAFYTGGVGFYLKDQQWRYAHSIWHLFVMGGSASHFALGWFYAVA
jgi:hemolysin III